jgi:hypothetical protein
MIFAQRPASSISAKFRARISHDIIIDTKNMFIMYGGKKITPSQELSYSVPHILISDTCICCVRNDK